MTSGRAVVHDVHPVLACSDVATSLRFYARLGFEVVFQDRVDAPRYAAVRRDGVELHLQWHDASQWQHDGDRPTCRFVVGDVDALSAEFDAVAGLDRTPVRDTTWGTREFHVRDPDGNGLHFHRDLPGDVAAPAATGAIVERLALPASERDLRDLAALLVDAVESGAAVSFVQPLPVARALQWWRDTTAAAGARTVFLVARDAAGIVGTVQLQPAWAPNQPHRAEVVKLLVHRRAQRAGLGALLMQAIERAAREQGFRLLTLDARAGGPAERLYRRLGWTVVGTIPRFAVDADGRGLHATVVFYKELAGAASSTPG